MTFVLHSILIEYDNDDVRYLTYVLEGGAQTKVLIAEVPGCPSQYDIVRSSNLSEAIADRVFSVFMDTLDSYKISQQKLYLGQEFAFI